AGPFRFALPPEARRLSAGAPIVVGIRPEDLAVCSSSESSGVPASVTQATDLGHYLRVTLDVPGTGTIVAFAQKSERIAVGSCTVCARSALLYADDRLVAPLRERRDTPRSPGRDGGRPPARRTAGALPAAGRCHGGAARPLATGRARHRNPLARCRRGPLGCPPVRRADGLGDAAPSGQTRQGRATAGAVPQAPALTSKETLTVVPRPGALSTRHSPPCSATRAAMADRPRPGSTPLGSKPRPSSRTLSERQPSSRRATRTVAALAPACRTTLPSASSTMR